eukprot:scaffold12131_cov112-Isochrysis_galbana.AAC.17
MRRISSGAMGASLKADWSSVSDRAPEPSVSYDANSCATSALCTSLSWDLRSAPAEAALGFGTVHQAHHSLMSAREALG